MVAMVFPSGNSDAFSLTDSLTYSMYYDLMANCAGGVMEEGEMNWYYASRWSLLVNNLSNVMRYACGHCCQLKKQSTFRTGGWI